MSRRSKAKPRYSMKRPPTALASRLMAVADAHALADRLDRNQRPQSDQATAVKLIRALLAGRAAGDIIEMPPE
jgi:hypothetical protein